MKRKLKNRDSIKNLHTIEEFDNYIAEVEPVVIEKKIAEHLKGNRNVINFEYSEVDESADVYLRDIEFEEADKLERFVHVHLANKTSKSIELNYIIT